jgi:hypothetical protein
MEEYDKIIQQERLEAETLRTQVSLKDQAIQSLQSQL